MKGSFIIVYLWVECIAILHGSTLRAQQTRPQIPVISRPQIPVTKNNFTSFTRKYENRGTFWMARNKAYLNHPDANFADQYSPNTNAVEIFEKRTVNSKFYINKSNPSIVYSQRSSSSMHYKKNGQWITIDTRLRPKGPLLYEASNQEDPIGFDIKRKSSYITTADGKTFFNAWKLFGKNGSVETLLATADWTHYTAGDDGIVVKNIFPGIDAEMKLSRGSIKTNFIVHANRFSSYKTLLFRDAFSNGHGGQLSYSRGNAGNGLVSSADFSINASPVFHIKEAVMYQKEKPSTYQFIPYYLDQNKLTLSIDGGFLNAAGRMGDVVIDPQVQDMGVLQQNTITGSHSNQDCSLDTACEYDFTVPAPAGATLIDAQFSFAFTANNPCAGQDGAFSFASGTCVSQKYAGTSPGPGDQDFPNQSILTGTGANLAGCLPSAVCGLFPQNIPFSFFFYRKCHGPEGCDGSCISAASDLTITLVGRTFDSVSVTASPANSCAGAPMTLTARGYYGVGPYSFTWQGLPQFNGDSVITVNPATNTTYTVQVNDQCILPITPPISKSINVNVFPKPPPPVLSSNSPVCTGGQLVLSVPPVAGTIYFISNPGSGLGGGQYTSTAVFNSVTAAYGGSWIAVATDANGCISDTGKTTVVIDPTLSPTATITSSATNICAGTLVTFNATAINAGVSPTYQWLLNSQKVGTNSPTYSGSSFANNDAISCIVSANGPCAGGFDVSNIIVLHVSAPVTPTFNTIGPLCQNSTPPALPSTSKEGIAGTWNPASINTATLGAVAYTFTPSAGSCATTATISIVIAGTITPTFDAIGPLCQNSTPPQVPLVSKEGITGTWNPANINTSALGTVTYSFTPSAGSCATTATLNITIVSVVSPSFPTIANSYCQNSTAPALPSTSKEGITGTWNPASINTSVPGTATYTFTPTAGGCATSVSLNISIVGTVTPTFSGIANSYCQNSTAPALPTISTEGISGTWSPASINTAVLGTATYIFTPAAGSCAAPVSLNITIASSFTLIFDPIGPLCQNSTPPALPATSKEGIPGTWNPASINTTALGTVTYIFTPAAGSCSTPASLNITIVAMVSPTFPTITNSYCQNSTVPALPSTSKEGITGTWSPASINTSVLGTTDYTFTASAGSCANSASLNITIVSTLTPTFDAIGPLCHNSTPPTLPPVSKEGITGTWSPASISVSALGTATYQFTPSSTGNCATTASMSITVVNTISPTFPTVGDSYCLNDIAPVLPTTSKEGINGTWNPSSINTADAGSTVYTFTPAGGQCGVPAQITLTVNPPPVLTMGPDLTIANGASTTLNVHVTGNIVSYQWTPSAWLNNAAIKDPVASPSSTTTYTLLVTDDNNCEASGSIKVTVSGRSDISVPNAFSPNGDGINDTWVITNLSVYPGATVDVFNRYGQPVFHSENSNKAWDGTYNGRLLPVGTYYYIIDLKNNEKKKAGSVTIYK
jgi:gliding motility-associated-like protein